MTIHDQLRELEARPSWALTRPIYHTPKVAEAWIERVNRVITADPVQGRELALTALRLTRLVGTRCLRVAGVCSWGAATRSLGDLKASARCYRFAFRFANGCSHCLGDVHRKYSYLLMELGRTEDALEQADESLRLYEERLDNKGTGEALVARGVIHWIVGRVDLAVTDHRLAVVRTPISEVYSRDVARHAYVRSLSHSDDPAHFVEALEVVADLRKRFKGHRDNSAPLAFIDQMEAGLLARQATQSRGWQRQLQSAKARQLLTSAVEFFESRHMRLPADTARADLAALEAMENRERVVRVLDVERAGASLRPLVARVMEACRASDSVFWGHLRALRDATVALGADPPLVPYGFVA